MMRIMVVHDISLIEMSEGGIMENVFSEVIITVILMTQGCSH